jgi:hypothetical protein
MSEDFVTAKQVAERLHVVYFKCPLGTAFPRSNPFVNYSLPT